MKRQLAHSAGVPFSKRGNQASGTVIVRPSARSTARESSVTLTFCAVTSLRSVSEILMPCLQQQTCVVRNQPLDLSNLDPPEAAAILKANRIKPELGLPFLPLHMDMRRLVMIRRVEEQPVWTGAKNGNDSSVYDRSIGERKPQRQNQHSMARVVRAMRHLAV
jgi:hypothetical protein